MSPHNEHITRTLYYFDELSDSAQNTARDWYRSGGLDYEWWDSIYESAVDAAKYLGITINEKTQTSIGGYTPKGKWDANKETRSTKTCIYFSGFSSQGDGACFYGTWHAADMRPLKELKADFATDKELWRIHTHLADFAEDYPLASCTSTRSTCHYSHERSTNLDAILGEDIDYNEKTHKPLEECLVEFMQWIYKRLEAEDDYLNSNESVDETIRANEYEFTEEGKRA